MSPSFNDSNFGQELAYDLRQKYAEIVSGVLTRVSDARAIKAFPAWLDALDDLYVEISQKLTDKEILEYKTETEKCYQILNEHKNIFKKLDVHSDKLYLVHEALKALEMWLRKKMEEKKMFGGKRDMEGLT